MIQIRNVPEPLHRTLKARAAMAGTSLSAYLLKELTELAAVPTAQEVIARIERLEPIVPQEKPADVLRRRATHGNDVATLARAPSRRYGSEP